MVDATPQDEEGTLTDGVRDASISIFRPIHDGQVAYSLFSQFILQGRAQKW